MPPKSAAVLAETERRVAFLNAASHALATINPAIARHLSWRTAVTIKQYNQSISQSNNQSNNPVELLKLDQSVVDHTCSNCSALLVPALTCTVKRAKIDKKSTKTPINQSINQPINQSTNQPVELSDNQSNPESINQSKQPRHLARLTALTQHCHQCGHIQSVKQSIVRRGFGGEKLSVKCDREKRITTIKKRKLDQSVNQSVNQSTAQSDNPPVNQKELDRQEEQALQKLKTQQKISNSTRPTQSINQSATQSINQSHPFAGSLFFKFQKESAQANKQQINQSSPTNSSSPTAPFTFNSAVKSSSPRANQSTNRPLSILEAAALKKKQDDKASKSKLPINQTIDQSTNRPTKPITVNPSVLAGGGLYYLMQGFAKR